MTPQIPAYLTAFEATTRPFIVAVGLGLIWIGALRMAGALRSRLAIAALLSVVLVIWLAVVRHFGAENAFFATAKPTVPYLGLALLVPLILAPIGLRLWNSLAKLVSAIPLPLLIASQVYRVAGVIFVVLWADGRLPWQFALPAGIGDMLTGGAALIVANLWARKSPGALRTVYGWSLFGIADLVVAVSTGVMTSLGPAHILALDAPNMLISSYPLVMIPAFAVPLALILHGAVLWRLRQESASAELAPA